jgi:large subunit ribosomal protein L35
MSFSGREMTLYPSPKIIERNRMPKMKSHSGASKRFKITKKGQSRKSPSFWSSFTREKTSDRKRKYSKTVGLAKGDAKTVKKLLGA